MIMYSVYSVRKYSLVVTYIGELCILELQLWIWVADVEQIAHFNFNHHLVHIESTYCKSIKLSKHQVYNVQV